MRLTRRYEFQSAHQLTGLREGHKCSRLHGHNYKIDLTVEPKGELVNGFVTDAENLDIEVGPIIKKLDHNLLNEVLDDGTPAGKIAAAQPTAENIATYLWERLGFLRNGPFFRLVNVRVYENDRLWVDVGV